MIYIKHPNGFTLKSNDLHEYVKTGVLLDVLSMIDQVFTDLIFENNDGLTQDYVEKRGQAALNRRVTSGLLADGKIVCDASNNPISVVEAKGLVATIEIELPAGELYVFTISNKPFGAYNGSHQDQ